MRKRTQNSAVQQLALSFENAGDRLPAPEIPLADDRLLEPSVITPNLPSDRVPDPEVATNTSLEIASQGQPVPTSEKSMGDHLPASEVIASSLADNPSLASDSVPTTSTEYNREKAIARFMEIGDALDLNDNAWKEWKDKSDEQLQHSLPIWEEYYASGRWRRFPKVGGGQDA